jgi:hypothetical protein
MTVKELRDWLDKQEAAWDKLEKNFYIPFSEIEIVHIDTTWDVPKAALDVYFDGEIVYMDGL